MENPTYSELLFDKRWRTKRNKIIKRDGNCCKGCSNKFLAEEFHSGICIKPDVSKYTDFSRMVFLLVDGSVLWSPYSEEINNVFNGEESYLIYYEKRETIPNIKIYGIQRNFSNLVFSIKNNFENLRSQSMELVKQMRNNPEEYVNEKRKMNLYDWGYVRSLHVHHTYYNLKLQPWEYPDFSLETYCWKCHEKIHSKKNIPIKDDDGNITGTVSPCTRCFGAGFFPEYKHVESGICFLCKGARYEELI